MLDRDAASEVATMPEAIGPAVLTFAIAGLAGGLATTVTTGGAGFISIVLFPILMVVVYAIIAGILHFIAGLFGGKATYGEYYRALGAGAVVLWLMVIPFVGQIASFWYLVVSVAVTERVQGISMGRAVATVLIPYLLVFALVVAGMMAGLVALFATVGGTAAH